MAKRQEVFNTGGIFWSFSWPHCELQLTINEFISVLNHDAWFIEWIHYSEDIMTLWWSHISILPHIRWWVWSDVAISESNINLSFLHLWERRGTCASHYSAGTLFINLKRKRRGGQLHFFLVHSVHV